MSSASSNEPDIEGRSIARLRSAESGEAVGFVILLETGEVALLWVRPRPSAIKIEPLPGEDLSDFEFDW